MKQAIFNRFGPADVIELAERPRPKLKKKQVLVRVAAAAVNPKDTFIRKGYYTMMTGKKFPMGIGFDYSGVVEESRLPDFREGDPVFGMINGWKGVTFAGYLVAGFDEIAPAPEKIEIELAAAIPLAAQTALQAIRDLGSVQPGMKICINGASGGVGTFAIQIARNFGCDVTTLTSPANFGLCEGLGASRTEDYRGDFLKEQGEFDLFFDVFGNLSIRQVSHLLTPRGIYISTVPGRKQFMEALFWNYFRRQKSKLVYVKSTREKLLWLRDAVDAGEVRPVLDAVYSLEESAAAHEHVETKRTRGKVVVRI